MQLYVNTRYSRNSYLYQSQKRPMNKLFVESQVSFDIKKLYIWKQFETVQNLTKEKIGDKLDPFWSCLWRKRGEDIWQSRKCKWLCVGLPCIRTTDPIHCQAKNLQTTRFYFLRVAAGVIDTEVVVLLWVAVLNIYNLLCLTEKVGLATFSNETMLRCHFKSIPFIFWGGKKSCRFR